MTIESISVEEITVDDSLQVREHIDGNTVETYRVLMKSNGPLGSLDVFKTNGGKYLLANGWHRLEAARQLGWPGVDCTVHTGNKRDAMLFAVGANAAHGQPLSRSDKTRAVTMLLQDEQWFQWSNAKVGRHCGVTAPTVARARERVINDQAIKKSLIGTGKRKRTAKGGRTVEFTPPKGRKPQTQADKNLADLNSALDTLAQLPFGGADAVELYGDRITDKANAAIEFASDLGKARAS